MHGTITVVFTPPQHSSVNQVQCVHGIVRHTEKMIFYNSLLHPRALPHIICRMLFSLHYTPAAHKLIRCSDWPPTQSVGSRSGQSHATHFRRRVGTPFTFAEWRAMCTFASVGTVKESHLIQLPLKDSCIVHVTAPDESLTADVGSETHSH